MEQKGPHTIQHSGNQKEGESLMRKVRSYDSVHARSPKKRSEGKVWVDPFHEKLEVDIGTEKASLPMLWTEGESSPGLSAPSMMASRFSRAANRKRYCGSRALEPRGAVSRSRSLASLTQADCSKRRTFRELPNLEQPPPLPQPEDENLDEEPPISEPISPLMKLINDAGLGQLTIARLFHFAVLLFFVVATLVDVTSPKGRWRAENSTNGLFHDTEVASPPSGFKLSAPDGGHVTSKRGLKLGPAMIESVMDALGPVLPFAGGVDLRREENWNWEDTTSKQSIGWFRITLPKWWGNSEALTHDNATPSVYGSEPANEKQADKTLSMRTTTRSNRKPANRNLVLAATDPFLSTETIKQLTLGELGLIFRYASNAIKSDFDVSEFRKKGSGGGEVSAPLRKALDAMDEAVATSRGDGTKPPIPESQSDSGADESPLPATFGEIDALYFCAALRLFAEWRIVRLTPDGYKGYAVGMRLGHKDVVQNIAKIETMIFEMLNEKAEKVGDAVHSPTLREVLIDEIENDVHPTSSLPQLKEKSAAMGLLWVRRQLHYQTQVFTNVLKVPEGYPAAIDAVKAAYATVYDDFHGWAVRKIFNYSFQAAPESFVLYRFMNPVLLNEITEKALDGSFDKQALEKLNINQPSTGTQTPDDDVDNERPRINESSDFGVSEHCKNVLIETNPFAKFGAHVACEFDKMGKNTGNEFDKLGRHVGNEWDKLTSNVGKILNKNKSKRRKTNKLSLSGDELDRYVNHMMTLDGHKNILIYLDVANEMLADLQGLFAEMNMDDPTRV